MSVAKIALLTSYPLNVTIGSGVVRMITGLQRAFSKLGCQSDIIHPDYDQTNPLSIAVQRFRFNRHLPIETLSQYDLVLGIDFDGYRLKGRLKHSFMALNAGILGDILRFEKGRDRRLLQQQSYREGQNVRQARLVFVPSRYSAGKIHQLYGVEYECIKIVPLGIDFDYWHNAIQQAERQRNRPPVILCVARQYPRKGVADLIRAFSALPDRFSDTQLKIVGGGPEMNANKALCQKLAIQDRVEFAGDVLDIPRVCYYYRNADIFCLPSYHETFGLVFLEAMAAGLPIVANRTTAVPEVVGDAEGILCAARNIPQLTGALAGLLDDKPKGIKMGRNGLNKARNMTWQTTARKLLADAGTAPGVE